MSKATKKVPAVEDDQFRDAAYTPFPTMQDSPVESTNAHTP
jgi:hypothetical protein